MSAKAESSGLSGMATECRPTSPQAAREAFPSGRPRPAPRGPRRSGGMGYALNPCRWKPGAIANCPITPGMDSRSASTGAGRAWSAGISPPRKFSTGWRRLTSPVHRPQGLLLRNGNVQGRERDRDSATRPLNPRQVPAPRPTRRRCRTRMPRRPEFRPTRPRLAGHPRVCQERSGGAATSAIHRAAVGRWLCPLVVLLRPAEDRGLNDRTPTSTEEQLTRRPHRRSFPASLTARQGRPLSMGPRRLLPGSGVGCSRVQLTSDVRCESEIASRMASDRFPEAESSSQPLISGS